MAENDRSEDGEEEAPVPLTNSEGVDLTQILELKAMTASERVRALVIAANNLIELKKNVRRV